jgi:alkaline phosphatase
MGKPNERKEQLWQGTKKALDILSQDEDGFFLMVESSMIDDYGHFNELSTLMEEVLDFDRTVGNVFEWASNHPGTLVVVTSDHETGGLTLLNGDIEKGEIECHFSSGGHSGVMVPVYSFGQGAEVFSGIYENTDIFYKMANALGLSL